MVLIVFVPFRGRFSPVIAVDYHSYLMIVSQWRSPVLLVSHHVTPAAPCFHLWVRKTFTARGENARTTKHK